MPQLSPRMAGAIFRFARGGEIAEGVIVTEGKEIRIAQDARLKQLAGR